MADVLLLRLFVRGTLGRLMVFVAVVATAAAGLCLFDGDEGGGIDLCAAALAVSLTLALPLPVTGRSVPALVRIRPLYAPDFPAPPPKA